MSDLNSPRVMIDSFWIGEPASQPTLVSPDWLVGVRISMSNTGSTLIGVICSNSLRSRAGFPDYVLHNPKLYGEWIHDLTMNGQTHGRLENQILNLAYATGPYNISEVLSFKTL